MQGGNTPKRLRPFNLATQMPCFVSGRPGRSLPKGGPGSPEVGGLGGRGQPRLSPNGRHVPLLPAGAVSPMGDPTLSRGETLKRNESEKNQMSGLATNP